MTEEFRRKSDREMHSQNIELLRTVGEIKVTLDLFIKSQEQHNQRVEKRLDDFDDRFRDVEKKTYLHAAVVAGIVGIGVSYAKHWLGMK